MNDMSYTLAIRALNDAFRRTLVGGTLVVTAGIVALGDERHHRIIAAVRAFDAFDPEEASWDEHDFGCFDLDGSLVFFRIEYFDPTRARHSSDPADPSKTERVLTIMLLSET
jgi:uncharacterized protein DUF3768